MFAFNAGDDPVTGGDNMVALKGFDQADGHTTEGCLDYLRVVSHLEPLRGLDDHGLLSEFHASPFAAAIAARALSLAGR